MQRSHPILCRTWSSTAFAAVTVGALLLLGSKTASAQTPRRLPRGLLERMDRNRDGILDPDETRENQRILERFGFDTSQRTVIDDVARDDGRGFGFGSAQVREPSSADQTEQEGRPEASDAGSFRELSETSAEDAPTVIVDLILVQRSSSPEPDNRKDQRADDAPAEEREAPASQLSALGALKKNILELVRGGRELPDEEKRDLNPALVKWLNTTDAMGRHDFTRYRILAVDRQTVVQQSGSLVGMIQSTQRTQFGIVNNTVRQETGTMVKLTPAISPDGTLLIDLELEHSALGLEEDGVPIAENPDGQPVRQPDMHSLTFKAVVRVPDRQPQVVLNRTSTTKRGVVDFALIVAAHVQKDSEREASASP